jgi:hypothetical protein
MDAVSSKGASVQAAAKPLLSTWSRVMAGSGRSGDVVVRFFSAYVMQGLLRALCEGGRGDDILLKGANAWSAWTSESGIPLFAAQIAAAAADGGAELLLRGADAVSAVSTRPTMDVDFQIRGWADPGEFVAYFKDAVSDAAFRAATGIAVDVDGMKVEPRENVAGVGVAMHGEATVGTTRSRWRIEAFVSPFPEPGVGMIDGAVAPLMASVAEAAVAERLKTCGASPGAVRAWLTAPGHLRDKVEALMREDARNAPWLKANVLDRWGPLLSPIPVRVVTPEFMLTEKMTAMWGDGGAMSGLRNLRHKDYYDCETILALATDEAFRSGFSPPVNKGMSFSPERARCCLEFAFAARGFGPPPGTAEGFEGLSDAFAEVVSSDGRRNAAIYDQVAARFRGRPRLEGERDLPQVLAFLRDGVERLGILPVAAPAPPTPMRAAAGAAPTARPRPAPAAAPPACGGRAAAGGLREALFAAAARAAGAGYGDGQSRAALRAACAEAVAAGDRLCAMFDRKSPEAKEAARIVGLSKVAVGALDRLEAGDRVAAPRALEGAVDGLRRAAGAGEEEAPAPGPARV